ncbi:acylase [Erythrobacter sp. SDW2]|uniref:acylase n=1 Tax=Erythrobacter sp. SDW2 TaxID=2907154 RepID=UPI001F2EAEA9|nr:acylase [Erythrobacter sp. SDW2]UIP06559.1 acylase [Erythrobacter sp. SDW2]
MKKWLVRISATLAALVLVALVGLMTWEPFFARTAETSHSGKAYAADLGGSQPITYTAEIIRDEFGVPHIHGKTDADVAYGVAIAQAEDDFFTLQDVVAMARGRYGAIAGEEGAQVDYAYHLLDARGTAERHYSKLPADTRALFEAYASGLNDYAATHPGELKLARLFPVNGEDIAAGFALRQPFFFGLGNIIGNLVSGKPLAPEFGPDIPGYPRAAEGQSGYDPTGKQARAFPLPWGEDGALSGSNAFAVTPAKSGGPSVLISNSHQPLEGGVAWYELVVESDEGWHFAGANFPGSPFPFLGHNRHLGWTNTVNRPDMTDVYRLEVDATGTKYKLDGKWLKLEQKTVTLPVKMGPVVLPIRQTIYRSQHGPVIKNDKGYFAIRYGGIDRIDQLDAYYRLNKARNLEEWQAQLARMAIPSTNFIYADEAGNIAYVYNAAIPDRAKGENWRGILNGTDSSLIWDGPVGYECLPKLINPASGWLYNSNNEPWTAAGAGSDLKAADFAPELGIETKQTNRSRRAYRLLSEAGLLDRAALERIKYDTAYAREGYVADLLAALAKLDLRQEPDLARTRDLLLQWDFNADGKGAGDALALLMIKDFMSAEYQNKGLPDAEEKLRAAADHLQSHFGRLDPPMGELLRLRQTPGPFAVDLPLDGGSDTLRASTTWDVDPDGRLALKHGDSFIMWAEWLPGQRVTSRSIQPFGAAITRPHSKHFTDQSRLFVRKQLKPVWFWREDVLANAISRKTVTSRR